MKILIKKAIEFKKFIKNKTFGFSNCTDSNDSKIIRYDEGLNKIENLLEGLDINIKESKVIDDGLFSFRLEVNELVCFEYVFNSDECIEDEELTQIGKETGWWSVHAMQNGSYEDILSLIDLFIFDDIMTFSEACTIWGLSESTLRKANLDSRFQEGEIRQSGKVWLVTKAAMERLYGEKKNG